MKKQNSKYTKLLISFIVMLSSIIGGVNAQQSMYFLPENTKIATQLSYTEFVMEPRDALNYKLENGRLIALLNGEICDNVRTGYYLKENDKIKYYREDHSIIGYYIPSQGRYYSRSEGHNDSKEQQFALLYDNLIYTVDNKPVYKIDEGFNPELVGFILFFILAI
ncbi:MAG: hypothetical protein QM660_15375 [Dysgonomonas sp.]